jgi:hypothetical protein
MRATLDTLLLACWAGLAVSALLWFLTTALPSSNLLGDHAELLGRLIVTGFPLLSAYRVHCAYSIPRATLWAIGLWFFSVLLLVSHSEQRAGLQQNAIILASLLFIALPVPMMRVWTELCRGPVRK